MTLVQWCEKAKVPYSATIPGSYEIKFDKELWFELWHLNDYRVSSYSAGTVWLVPRNL